MGKLYKIEVDDKFPIAFGNELFAKCDSRNEIWPLIFSKAICKLNRYKYAQATEQLKDNTGKVIPNKFEWKHIKGFNFDDLVGDGSVMYSLTGLIPETLCLNKMIPEDWNKVHRLLNDQEYTLNSSYISCFSRPNHKGFPPSNRLKHRREILRKPSKVANEYMGFEDSCTCEDKLGSPMKRRQKALQKEVMIKDEHNIPHNLIPGFAYSILEGFANK